MKFSIKTNSKDLRAIENMPKEYETGLKRGLGYAMKFLNDQIKNGIGQGGRPKNKSGKLRDSFSYKVFDKGGYITSTSPYAMIHEYGGRIQGKPWLMFSIGGQFRKVDHVDIPARPYIAPAIDSNIDKANEMIAREILEELNRG